MDNFSQIIVALDQLTLDEISKYSGKEFKEFKTYKVGLELFNKYGISIVNQIKEKYKKEIFLDLKLHDIPNTVYNAIKSLSSSSPKFLTIHLTGGEEMINKAIEARDQFLPSTKLLGVSYLTSLNDSDFSDLWGASKKNELFEKVFNLAKKVGIDGIVCSPQELGLINTIAPNLIKVTPGIRIGSNRSDDQSRTLTPSEALSAGSDFLVIGRPLRGGQREEIIEDINNYFAQ